MDLEKENEALKNLVEKQRKMIKDIANKHNEVFKELEELKNKKEIGKNYILNFDGNLVTLYLTRTELNAILQLKEKISFGLYGEYKCNKKETMRETNESNTLEGRYLERIEKINNEFISVDPLERRAYCADNEAYHGAMDNIILDCIKELGYNKIALEYEKAEEYFWYA